MAKDMLVRGQDKVSRQKGRVGVFLRVQLINLSWLLFIVPRNQQGNQVRIYK